MKSKLPKSEDTIVKKLTTPPPIINLSMIDVSTKHAVFSASSIMVVVLLLCVIWRVFAIILMIAFLLVALWTGWALWGRRKPGDV